MFFVSWRFIITIIRYAQSRAICIIAAKIISMIDLIDCIDFQYLNVSYIFILPSAMLTPCVDTFVIVCCLRIPVYNRKYPNTFKFTPSAFTVNEFIKFRCVYANITYYIIVRRGRSDTSQHTQYKHYNTGSIWMSGRAMTLIKL